MMLILMLIGDLRFDDRVSYFCFCGGRRGACAASICSQFDNDALRLTAARCSIPRDGDESCKLACTFDASNPAGCLPLAGFIRDAQARGYATEQLTWVRLNPPPPRKQTKTLHRLAP